MPDVPAGLSTPPQTHTPRPPEDVFVDERNSLTSWLDYLRHSCMWRAAGLDDDQVRWRPGPELNSIGGILKHLAYSERWWFRIVFADDQSLPLDFKADGMRSTFLLDPDESSTSLIAFYTEECALADAAIGTASLDEWSRTSLGRKATLRWIFTHMIEETARHAGHLDITRELIDGRRGR